MFHIHFSTIKCLINCLNDIGDRPHVCKKCGKGFIQKVHLRNHELKHTGERPYLCIQCGKSFLTSSNLKEHTKHHCTSSSKEVSKKIYVCQLGGDGGCGAKYSNLVDLKIHERKHTGNIEISIRMNLKMLQF